VHGHIIRSGGTDRLLIYDNTFANPDDTYTGDMTTRGTITLHQGSYAYIARNHLSQGILSVGPLGSGSGLNDIGARIRWTVFDGNVIDSKFKFLHGSEHTMFRNNVIRENNNTAIEIDGYSTTYKRGTVDVNIINNTAINTGANGKFLNVLGDVDGIALVNNLYLAPNLKTGGNGSGVVFVFDSDLHSFTRITGNVWPVVSPDAYAQGGYFYVWPYFSNQSGYKTPSEWDAYGVVSNEHYQDGSYNSSSFAPSTSSTAANAGVVWNGVFEDMYGKIRPATGSWTAGAVDV